MPLTGNGVPPGPAINVTPSRLDFGNQRVGTISDTRVVTVRSSGTATLILSSVEVTDAWEFKLFTDDCPRALEPGATCAISVAFAPAEAGVREVTLEINADPSVGQRAVPLTGNGTVPALDVTPPAIDFGDRFVGDVAETQSVTVTNTRSVPLDGITVSLAGANPGEFSANGDCPSTLGAGTTCTISVAFAPTAAGPQGASLVVDAAADPDSRFTVALTGNGIVATPGVGFVPGDVQFSDQLVGTSSEPRQVFVRNTGTAPLRISAVGLGGANPGDFDVRTTDCAFATLESASCTVSVGFAPKAPGARSATLVVHDNAPGSPHTVALSGSGVVRADVGVSIGATPNPVRTGTTLTYTITVSNHGPSPATGVVLNETLPSGSKFVGYTAQAGTTCSAPAPGATGTLTCYLGTLPVGSNVTQVAVKVVAPGGSSVSNTASVTSTSNDPNPANDSATVTTPVYGRK